MNFNLGNNPYLVSGMSELPVQFHGIVVKQPVFASCIPAVFGGCCHIANKHRSHAPGDNVVAFIIDVISYLGINLIWCKKNHFLGDPFTLLLPVI
jgi:hypothetical protein